MAVEYYCDVCNERIESGAGWTVEWQKDIVTNRSIVTDMSEQERRVVCGSCWPGDSDGEGWLESLGEMLK